MSILKAISPSSSRFQEIEFLVLLGWALLFPVKQSYIYFLGFICLLVIFLLRKIFSLKNIALSGFSFFLFLLNALLIFSGFFSPHPFRSLLFTGDVLLLSFWFLFFYIEKSDMDRYLRLLALIISVSSLIALIFFLHRGGHGPASQVFEIPALQGIVSALAALVFLQSLLRRYGHANLVLLALNCGAVVVSASKAVFLGLAVFAFVMIFSMNRKWLAYLGGILLLLLLVPNPLRQKGDHSLDRESLVLNRLNIWRMSARMFRHNFWTGVGPGLFVEAARRFNFPQEKGAARYGRLPESPHSDYWKVITENGLPGLVFIFLALFFAVRGMLSPPWFPLPKLLLAFLLVQMFLFNFIFNFFFLLVFFLLLLDFMGQRQKFMSLQPGFRLYAAAVLFFMAALLYLFPFITDRCLQAASRENDIIRRYTLLKRAALFSPLDERVPLARAGVLGSFARSAGNQEAWSDAVENLHLAQRLSQNSSEAFIMESELFREFLGRNIKYPALAEEILAPRRRAEELDPFNPFLKLQQAVILREYGRDQETRRLALSALALEPDYIAAILFIHSLDGLPPDDPVLRERISRIRAKANALRVKPGSYLFNLYQLPASAAGQ